ncbi:hypothetical protein ACSL103130_09645 [Actinomyces slackii]
MTTHVGLVHVDVDVVGQDGVAVGRQAAGVDHDGSQAGHGGAVGQLLAHEDHVRDARQQVDAIVHRQDDPGHRHHPLLGEGPGDLLEGLGVEHGVGVHGDEQVRPADLPEGLGLGVALAPIGRALPGGLNPLIGRLGQEPLPLLGVGALRGAVVDHVDLLRRLALGQQRSQHAAHHLMILVVQRDEHRDPAGPLPAPDDAPLGEGQCELERHQGEDHVEGPDQPRIEVPSPRHRDAPVQPDHQERGDQEQGGGVARGGGKSAGQARAIGELLGVIDGGLPLLGVVLGGPRSPARRGSRRAPPARAQGDVGLEQELDPNRRQEDDPAHEHHEHAEGHARKRAQWGDHGDLVGSGKDAVGWADAPVLPEGDAGRC